MGDGIKKVSKWYFGGIASAGAACCTHPLDLIKVHLQTQQEGKINVVRSTIDIVRKQGILALYNGLSASVLRQLTYSMTRFAIYEAVKQSLGKDGGAVPFYQRIGIAAIAGASGGFVGTPADMVNVRMQNDIKLPPENRRNYKHAIDGIVKVLRNEGVTGLFRGATTATTRAVFVTVGQLGCYDQIKMLLMQLPYFDDSFKTHLTASFFAGAIATTLTQPLDVLKTRAMSAKPGEFNGIWHIVRYTARLGPMGFFKGFVPAFVRLGPHTVITFLFLEQLRIHFGVPIV